MCGCWMWFHFHVEIQGSALLSFLLPSNFDFLQWLVTLEEWKGRWFEVLWHGFLGSLAPLVASLSLDWSWLSHWAVVPSLPKAMIPTSTLAAVHDGACQQHDFSLVSSVRNETVFVSGVDSHGNSSLFAERLITVMVVNEKLQELHGD